MSVVRCIARAYAVEQTRAEVHDRVRDATGPFVCLTLDSHGIASPGLITGDGPIDVGIVNIEAVWDT